MFSDLLSPEARSSSFAVMKISILFVSILALSPLRGLAADVPPFAGGYWVDLSHDFSAETIYWPTAHGFELESEHKGMTPGGYFYAANRYSASEHGGTHIDAPIHFAEGHPTVDQIPLERLTGAAIVVDVSAEAIRLGLEMVREQCGCMQSRAGILPAPAAGIQTGKTEVARREALAGQAGCLPYTAADAT